MFFLFLNHLHEEWNYCQFILIKFVNQDQTYLILSYSFMHYNQLILLYYCKSTLILVMKILILRLLLNHNIQILGFFLKSLQNFFLVMVKFQLQLILNWLEDINLENFVIRNCCFVFDLQCLWIRKHFLDIHPFLRICAK